GRAEGKCYGGDDKAGESHSNPPARLDERSAYPAFPGPPDRSLATTPSAAGFSEIGPSAAAAAHDRGELFHDLPGLDAARQIGRDCDDHLHLAVGGGR